MGICSCFEGVQLVCKHREFGRLSLDKPGETEVGRRNDGLPKRWVHEFKTANKPIEKVASGEKSLCGGRRGMDEAVYPAQVTFKQLDIPIDTSIQIFN